MIFRESAHAVFLESQLLERALFCPSMGNRAAKGYCDFALFRRMSATPNAEESANNDTVRLWEPKPVMREDDVMPARAKSVDSTVLKHWRQRV